MRVVYVIGSYTSMEEATASVVTCSGVDKVYTICEHTD
jgi:hypothetical protein